MGDRTILIIIVVALAAYFLYPKSSNTYTIPSGYKGAEGLDYLRKNYASELAQVRSLCINQFKGNWVDTSNTIGCYNMQSFSEYYCNTDTVKNLVNLCNSIEGDPICSSTQASCTI